MKRGVQQQDDPFAQRQAGPRPTGDHLDLFAEPAPPPHPVDMPRLLTCEKSEQTVTFHAWPCRTCGNRVQGSTPILREYWKLTDGSREVRWQCIDCYWAKRNERERKQEQ